MTGRTTNATAYVRLDPAPPPVLIGGPEIFALSRAEQDELLQFLWPQYLDPNQHPAVHGLLNRLMVARDARAGQ
jgi:hypothetical protein